MPQQLITRYQIIKLSEVPARNNEFGDLLFTDDQGNEYKISNKRSAFFSIIRSNIGKEIKLGWSKYNGNEYINNVGIMPTTQATTQKQTGNVPQRNPTTQPAKPPVLPISGPEKGMILKEIGDSLRAGLFTSEDQPGLWDYYKAEIGRVTGVKVN